MSDQVLERFHRALIEEIQTQRPEYLTAPFTVAEIYQNLVPYGSHRDRIGVEMNGDYEDALIRLLAGEGGYLILDSEPALRDLRAELEVSNPNTGLYREFAAVDVRLNQAYLDLSAAAMDQLPDLVRELDAEDPVGMGDLAPDQGATPPVPPVDELQIVPPGVDIFEDTESVGPAASAASEPTFLPDETGPSRAPLAPEFVDESAHFETENSVPAPTLAAVRAEPAKRGGGGTCVWCRGELPNRADLRFCPHCGIDQNLIPCPACGDEVEIGWRFCITCGTEVGA